MFELVGIVLCRKDLLLLHLPALNLDVACCCIRSNPLTELRPTQSRSLILSATHSSAPRRLLQRHLTVSLPPCATPKDGSYKAMGCQRMFARRSPEAKERHVDRAEDEDARAFVDARVPVLQEQQQAQGTSSGDLSKCRGVAGEQARVSQGFQTRLAETLGF
eukprot:472492-Hanusia_phi.AAC.10